MKVAILEKELLPVVGEGVTGAPILGPVSCPSGGSGLKAAAFANTGVAYVLNADGSSCQGNDGAGHPRLDAGQHVLLGVAHAERDDRGPRRQPLHVTDDEVALGRREIEKDEVRRLLRQGILQNRDRGPAHVGDRALGRLAHPELVAVEIGRADAAGVSLATAIVAAKHSDGKLEAAPGGPVTGATVDAGIAFKKGNMQLGKAIEAALKKFPELSITLRCQKEVDYATLSRVIEKISKAQVDPGGGKPMLRVTKINFAATDKKG